MGKMSKGYKILISVIAFVCTFISASFVYGYVNETGLSFGWAFLFRFAATMSLVSVCWLIAALFRKERKTHGR